MKHRVAGKKLNRDIKSRRALLKNLMRSLIEYQKVETTLAKAKAVQGEFEHLITKAKKGTVPYRRQIDSVINDRSLTNKLVSVIAPAVKRTSGYTRIIRLKKSMGDNSLKVRLELVDKAPVVTKIENKPTKESKERKEKKAASKPDTKPTTPTVAKPTKPKAPVNPAANRETVRKTP